MGYGHNGTHVYRMYPSKVRHEAVHTHNGIVRYIVARLRYPEGPTIEVGETVPGFLIPAGYEGPTNGVVGAVLQKIL